MKVHITVALMLIVMLLKPGQTSEVEDYAKEVCYDNVLAYLKAGQNSTIVNKGYIGTTSIEIIIKNLDLSNHFKGARVVSMPQMELQKFFSPASRRTQFFSARSTDYPFVIVELDIPFQNGTVQHLRVLLENPILPIRSSYATKFSQRFKCLFYSNVLRANIINLLSILNKFTPFHILTRYYHRTINPLVWLSVLTYKRLNIYNLVQIIGYLNQLNNSDMIYFIVDYIFKNIPEFVKPNISILELKNCKSLLTNHETVFDIPENLLKPELQEVIAHGNREDIKNIICLTLLIIPVDGKYKDLPNRLRMLAQVFLKEIPDSTWDVLIPQIKEIIINDLHNSVVVILKIITATELVPPHIRLQTYSVLDEI